MRTTRQTLLLKARDPKNAQAWEEFFDQYAGPIQGYARKLGLDPADAADVLQETMVELIRILPNFTYDKKRGLFRNFVLTITHRRVQAAWRRRRTRREVLLEDAGAVFSGGPEVVDPGNTPGAEAELKWREEIFQEALRCIRSVPGLDAHTLDIFQAHVIHNRPVREVATQFGVTPNLVYQIKHRLVNRLRKWVAPLAEELGEIE